MLNEIAFLHVTPASPVAQLNPVESLHTSGKVNSLSESLLDEWTSGEIAIDLQQPITNSAVYKYKPLILCHKQQEGV